MIMNLLFDLCTNSNVLTVFYILKIVFNIVCIIIPILLMYRFFVPMFKTVINGKSITEHLPGVFKSFIAGLVIFLLPGILSFVFGDLLGEKIPLTSCFTNAEVDIIKSYREKEENERKENLKNYKEQLNKDLADQAEKEKEENDKIGEILDKNKDKLEQEQNSNNSGGSPSSSNTNLKTSAKNIIIGDSRTVGMCAHITGDWTNCQFSNGGAFVFGDDIFIAQGSMGYSWFNSTAVSAVNNIINSNPDTTFNIYSLMGVNFLLSDIDKYIPKYNELASGSWSEHNLILVSVNPVDENKEAQNGYSTKNANIVTFNTKLKNGTSGVSNIKYCDTYNPAMSSLSTSDGLHYTSSTSMVIYNTMMSCGG